MPELAEVFTIFVAIMVLVPIHGNRIIGNQVKILDSTRCCNLLDFFKATLPLSQSIGMGRRLKWRESEDLP
jgi:hypothetical protein